MCGGGAALAGSRGRGITTNIKRMPCVQQMMLNKADNKRPYQEHSNGQWAERELQLPYCITIMAKIHQTLVMKKSKPTRLMKKLRSRPSPPKRHQEPNVSSGLMMKVVSSWKVFRTGY